MVEILKDESSFASEQRVLALLWTGFLHEMSFLRIGDQNKFASLSAK